MTDDVVELVLNILALLGPFPPMKAGKIGRQTLPYLQVCVICFCICLTLLFPNLKICIFISLLLYIIEQNLLKQIQLEKSEVFATPINFLDSFKVDVTRYSNIHLWMWQIHVFFWAIKLATLAWTNWIAWPNRYIHMWFKVMVVNPATPAWTT